jgi:Pheromone A receptor
LTITSFLSFCSLLLNPGLFRLDSITACNPPVYCWSRIPSANSASYLGSHCRRPHSFDTMSTSNHVFIVFSFITFILVSIPLPWHWRARNSATCIYILWVSSSNLIGFIDSILWDGNILDKAPVWCDIGKFIWWHVPDHTLADYHHHSFHRRPCAFRILCGDSWSVFMYATLYIPRPFGPHDACYYRTSAYYCTFVALVFLLMMCFLQETTQAYYGSVHWLWFSSCVSSIRYSYKFHCKYGI